MAHPPLTFDHVGTNPIIISERKRPSLTSDHVGTPPTTLSERPSTHIRQPMLEMLNTYTWACEELILHAKRLYTYI